MMAVFGRAPGGLERRRGLLEAAARRLPDEALGTLYELAVERLQVDHEILGTPCRKRSWPPVYTMLRTSFCAVPAFIRVEPVTIPARRPSR
jgi:hypothetical protein